MNGNTDDHIAHHYVTVLIIIDNQCLTILITLFLVLLRYSNIIICTKMAVKVLTNIYMTPKSTQYPRDSADTLVRS